MADVAPALYRISPSACLERLELLDVDVRDSALFGIARFLLRGRVPNDPAEEVSAPEREVSYDTLVDVVGLARRMETDWMIYATARDVAAMFRSTRKHYAVNLPQREVIAARFEAIAKEKLPIHRHIRHCGYRIVTIASALQMRQAKSCDWKPVLEEAKNLENLADRALVSETVALSLPANMSAERDHLLALARADVRKIPSELDQLERFIGFAEDLQKIDTKVCRELIAEAQTVLGRTAEGVERHKKRLIDIAFRIDDSVATALIEKFDDHEDKRDARRQLKLLKIRKELKDTEPEAAITQVGQSDLQGFGWLMVKALHSSRIQHFHPSLVRHYLEVIARHPLHRVFPLLLWYIDNALSRFSDTNQAASFLRPIFDATVVGAQLAGQIAGRTLTRLKAVRMESTEFGKPRTAVFTPHTQEEARKIVSTWLERHIGDSLKIADPDFGPADLSWLQLIRMVKPTCEITVVTSKHSQPGTSFGEEIEDVYVNAGRQLFDQKPPKVRIAVMGGEHDRQSPIQDRWFVTGFAGLKLNASLNSIGQLENSELSEIVADEAEEKSKLVEQYLSREKAEHNGQGIRLSLFWLL